MKSNPKKLYSVRLNESEINALKDFGSPTEILEQALQCLALEVPNRDELMLRYQFLRILPSLEAIRSSEALRENEIKNALDKLILFAHNKL